VKTTRSWLAGRGSSSIFLCKRLGLVLGRGGGLSTPRTADHAPPEPPDPSLVTLSCPEITSKAVITDVREGDQRPGAGLVIIWSYSGQLC
jgi:hypothetical protein